MTIEELNSIADGGGMDEFIRVCEARQVKALSRTADVITGGGARLVLLAGASSAGKTTTAKRICTQLRVNGVEAMHLSTDDYFVGNSRNPRDENGEFDYETVYCVDMERLDRDLNALLSGEPVRLRKFDFIVHEGRDADVETRLARGGAIVLEGLHALNPMIASGVCDALKFRMFIEPQTQLEVFGDARLPSADGRLLRRLVRDNSFRKLGPAETFKTWPKVLAGERKWIDPFRGNADATFDSGLEYELAVLKPYAAGLLEVAKHKRPDDPRPQMLSALLSTVRAVSPNCVPGDSILRETIGGSLLEY